MVMEGFYSAPLGPSAPGFRAAGMCQEHVLCSSVGVQQAVGPQATAGAVFGGHRERGEGFDHQDIRGSRKPPAPAACSGGSSALSPSPGAELLRVLLSFIAVLEEKCLSLALL